MNADQERFYNHLRPGDVILVGDLTTNPASISIRMGNFLKRGYKDRVWTHAALYVGEGQVVEAFPTGILKHDVREAYFGEKVYQLALLRRAGLNATQISAWTDFCAGECSEKYDFRALLYFAVYVVTPEWLLFLLDLPWVEKLFKVGDSYFCSELVAAGLQKTGDYCFEEIPCRIMPVDFLNPLIFETIDLMAPPKKPGLWAAVERWVVRVTSASFYILIIVLFFGATALLGGLLTNIVIGFFRS